jgi:signal peptidase I
MNPTFRTGDLLYLSSYAKRRIRRGDVIVFLPSHGRLKITHRVISISRQGIETQGDNNNESDLEFLNPENILGRVDYFKRNGKRYRVWGGAVGLLYAFSLHLLLPVKQQVSALLHYPYRFLAELNVLSRIPYLRSKIRVVSFKRACGEELQLLFGSRIIGRLLPGKNEWWIKRPFRLFLDSNLLSRKY